MNYACISEQPFVTKKDLTVKKSMSPTAREIREFYCSHSFSVEIDSETVEPKVKITKEQNET